LFHELSQRKVRAPADINDTAGKAGLATKQNNIVASSATDSFTGAV
jgi:hypothetical protein